RASSYGVAGGTVPRTCPPCQHRFAPEPMKPHTSGVFKSHCAAVASNFVPLAALVFWYALVRMPDNVISDPLCKRHEPVVGGGGGTVAPPGSAGAGGATVTAATGTGVTVTVAVPLCPSLVAVIVALPIVTPVTRPVVETLATAEALDAHVTVRPVSVFPAES